MQKKISPGQAEALSEKGYNTIDIARALGISKAGLYKRVDLMDAIHKGHISLKKKVSEAFLDSLADNPANQQMLVKRLGLFNQHIDITRPTDAKSALDNLSRAMKQYSEGEVSESQLRTIEAVLNSYIKGYELTQLEERLQVLEDAEK